MKPGAHSRFADHARHERRVRFFLALAAIMAAVVLMTGCSDPVAEADSLVAEGDLSGAESLYREALASDPENLEALCGMAVVLALQHRYDEALVAQERVVAVDLTDSLTRVELGFNYLNHQGRAEDAVRVLGEAAALDASAKNLTFLAQAQAVAGRTKDAERTLEEALGIDPTYQHAYQVLVKVLEDDGRTDEASRVRERAVAQGITLIDVE
ncbi:MAG: tetratricopeptide repeat protein [Thermoleophilia bacterium]|nr:tetratricopeptide repeat protein [Thermoleophilia bacterium]